MKLTAIKKITGTLELVSGLHIGSGNTEMHIGGTDNPVIKNPDNQQPYIPGSSIKGKVRSLLEWQLGVVGDTGGSPLGFKHISKIADAEVKAQAENLLKLFGGAPEGSGNHDDSLVKKIGPTRLAFWDCPLEADWAKKMNDRNLLPTETKMENTIDRIRGVAEHPRNTERVPAGAKFDFQLTLRIHDDEEKELLPMLWRGLALLKLTGLGGSGSRGYGKVEFAKLEMDGKDQKPELDKALNDWNT